MTGRLYKAPDQSVTGFSSLKTRLAKIPESRIFFGLFVFAFIIRAIYLFQLRNAAVFSVLVADGYVYDDWARQISKGNWLGNDVFYQAPLYPYFLAVIYTLFGHDPLIVRIIQILMGSASCLFLALAGRSFFSSKIGMLAGFLLAVYAPAIFFDGLIQKAGLDLFFSTLLLFLLGKTIRDFRWPWFLCAGIVLGCFALTRENALILAPVICLWIFIFFRDTPIKNRFQTISFFALGIALTLTPVGLRNRLVGGEFFLTTSQFGPNFFIGNNEKADGQYSSLLWGRGSALLERKDATELAEKALGRKLTSREVSRYWTSRALAYIRSQPANWLRLMGKKWLMTWNAKEIPDSEEPVLYYDESPLLAALGSFMHFGAICPLALLGIYATWKDRRRLVLLYMMVLGLAASVALFYVFARYRYPMVPVLVLFAAAGVLQIISLVKQRKTKALLFCGLLLAAAAAITNWKLTPDENPRALAYYNTAVGLDREGKTDEAIAYYEKSLKYKPDYIQGHINLGILLVRKGKLDEAIVHHCEALRIKPNNPVAYNNLANALLKQEKFAEAIACYSEALKNDPDNAVFHNNLALALAKRGNLDEAIAHYQQALRLQPGLSEAQNGLAIALKKKKKLKF